MLKKCNRILNIIIGSSVGVFLSLLIYNFVDYKKHSLLYAIQSAPWYTSSIIYGLVTIFIILIVIITKIVISKLTKKWLIINLINTIA